MFKITDCIELIGAIAYLNYVGIQLNFGDAADMFIRYQDDTVPMGCSYRHLGCQTVTNFKDGALRKSY